jgi:hypothetical protein
MSDSFPAFVRGVLAGLLLAMATTGGAQDASDLDDDGVPDAGDVCPATAAGELVGPDGCTLCPCQLDASNVPWTSREAYLECVQARIREMRAANELGRRAAKRAWRYARSATCGDDTQIVCCIYGHGADRVGRCLVTTKDLCDAVNDPFVARGRSTEILGYGSCRPNPCRR